MENLLPSWKEKDQNNAIILIDKNETLFLFLDPAHNSVFNLTRQASRANLILRVMHAT